MNAPKPHDKILAWVEDIAKIAQPDAIIGG